MELESVVTDISNKLIYDIQIEKNGFGKYVVSGISEDYSSYISDYLPETPKQDIKKIAYLVKENIEDYINNILSVGAKPIRYGQTIQDIYNTAMQLRGLNPASSDDLFTEVGERLGITLDENIRPLIIAIYNWQPGQDMTDVTNAMQQMGGVLPGGMDLSGTSTPELGTIPAMEGYTYGPGGGGPGIVASKSIPIKPVNVEMSTKKLGKSIIIKLAQDDEDNDDYSENDDVVRSDEELGIVRDERGNIIYNPGIVEEGPGFWEHEQEELSTFEIQEKLEEQEVTRAEEELEAEQGDYKVETQEFDLSLGDAPGTEDMDQDTKSALGLTRDDLVKDNLLYAITARTDKMDYKGSKELATQVALYNKAWNIGDSKKAEGIIDIVLGYGDEKKAKELLAENFGMSYDKADQIIDIVNYDLGDWKNGMIDNILRSYNKSIESHKKPGKELKRFFYTEEDIDEVLMDYGKKLKDQGMSEDEVDKKLEEYRKSYQQRNTSSTNLAREMLEGALIQRSKMLISREQPTGEAADLLKNVIDASSDVIYSTESPQWFKSINHLIASMPLSVANDVVDLMGNDKFTGLARTIFDQTADNREDIAAKEKVLENASPDVKKGAEIALGVAEGKLRDKATKIYENFYHDMLLTIAGIPGAEEVNKNIAGWIDYFRPTRPLKTRMLGEETSSEHFRESWLPAYNMIRGWAEYGNDKSNAISRLPTSDDPTKDLQGIERTIRKHQTDNPDVPIQTDRISKYLVVNVHEIGEDNEEKVRTIKTINPLYTKHISRAFKPKELPDPELRFYSAIDRFKNELSQVPVKWEGLPETEVDISVDELTTGEKYPAEVIKRSPILENYKTELDNIKNQLEPIYTDLRYDYSNPQAGPVGRPSPEEYYESTIGKIIELQKELNNLKQETITEEVTKYPRLQSQLEQQSEDLSSSISDLLDKTRELSNKAKEFKEPTIEEPTLESFNQVVSKLDTYVNYADDILLSAKSGEFSKSSKKILSDLLNSIETNMNTFREDVNNSKNQLKESLSEKDLSTLKNRFSEAKFLYSTLGEIRNQVKELLSTEPKEIPPKKETETKEHVPTLIDNIVEVLEHKPEFAEWRKEHLEYKGDINQKALSDVLQDDVLREYVADAMGIKGGEATLKKLLTSFEQEGTTTEPEQEETIIESKPGSFVITDSGPGIITSILEDKFSIINLKGESDWIDITNLADSVISPDTLSKANNTKLSNMYQAWLRHPGKKASQSIPIKSVGMSIPLNFNAQQVSIPINIL